MTTDLTTLAGVARWHRDQAELHLYYDGHERHFQIAATCEAAQRNQKVLGDALQYVADHEAISNTTLQVVARALCLVGRAEEIIVTAREEPTDGR
jgi:hypothetical protein